MAGIEYEEPNRYKGIDYNKEVPLYKEVPDGKFTP
jgi:hypothetical protein